MPENGDMEDTSSPEMRRINLFICYRRDDGGTIARELRNRLSAMQFFMGKERYEILPFLDESVGAVSNWRDHNLKALDAAGSLVLILTPGVGADTSGAEKDWVHEELRWWKENREGVPPLILDTLDIGLRYLPKEFRAQWCDVQRIVLTEKMLSSPQAAEKNWNQALLDLQSGISDRHSDVVKAQRDQRERSNQKAARIRKSLVGVSWLASLLLLTVITSLVLLYVENQRSKKLKDDTDSAISMATVVTRNAEVETTRLKQEAEAATTEASTATQETVRLRGEAATLDEKVKATTFRMKEAERQFKDKTARTLSSFASRVENSNSPAKALSLACQALAEVSKEPASTTLRTTLANRVLWLASRSPRDFRDVGQGREAITASPSGNFVLMMNRSEHLSLDILCVKETRPNQDLRLVNSPDKDSITGKFSTDDQFVVVAYRSSNKDIAWIIEAHQVSDGKLLWSRSTENQETAYSVDDHNVYVMTDNGKERVLKILDLLKGSERLLPFGSVLDSDQTPRGMSRLGALQKDKVLIALARDGEHRVVFRCSLTPDSNTSLFMKIDITSLQVIQKFSVPHKIASFRVTPDGKRVVAVVRLTVLEPNPYFDRFSKKNRGINPLEDDVVLRKISSIKAWDVATGSCVGENSHTESREEFRLESLSPDGAWVFVSSGDSGIRGQLCNLESGEEIYLDTEGPYSIAKFSPDSRQFWFANTTGMAGAYNLGSQPSFGATFRVANGTSVAFGSTDSAWSIPDAKSLATLDWQGRLHFYSWDAPTRLVSLGTPPRVAWTKHAKSFVSRGQAFAWEDGVDDQKQPRQGQYFHGPDFVPIWTAPMQGAFDIEACGFDPAHKHLLLAISENNTRSLQDIDASSGKVSRTIPVRGIVSALCYTEVGNRMLAAVRQEGEFLSLNSWSLTDGEPTTVCRINNVKADFDFAENGDVFVASDSESARITLGLSSGMKSQATLDVSKDAGLCREDIIGLVRASHGMKTHADGAVELILPTGSVVLSSSDACRATFADSGLELMLPRQPMNLKARIFSEDAGWVCEISHYLTLVVRVSSTHTGGLLADFEVPDATLGDAWFEGDDLVILTQDGRHFRTRIGWNIDPAPPWLLRLGEAMVGVSIRDFQEEVIHLKEVTAIRRDFFADLKKDADAGGAVARMVQSWLTLPP